MVCLVLTSLEFRFKHVMIIGSHYKLLSDKISLRTNVLNILNMLKSIELKLGHCEGVFYFKCMT